MSWRLGSLVLQKPNCPAVCCILWKYGISFSSHTEKFLYEHPINDKSASIQEMVKETLPEPAMDKFAMFHVHWQGKVFMMPTLSSLETREIIMSISNNDKGIIITNPRCQWSSPDCNKLINIYIPQFVMSPQCIAALVDLKVLLYQCIPVQFIHIFLKSFLLICCMKMFL